MASAIAATYDEALQSYVNGRIQGLRVNRYSWWTHWRELADYFLPRRYKWIITPNQMARGSPINQHILDSTGVICARNLASGLLMGKTPPNRPWFKYGIGYIDSTGTNPVSLWLAEVERIINLILHESNFYNSFATFFYDLVTFGTAVMMIYEDFESVINCYNPCAGEYYVDINGQYRPDVLYREFTMTIDALVGRFGRDNVSEGVRRLYDDPAGANRTREVVVAHAIEPNNDGMAAKFGFSDRYAYRECYWEYGGSSAPQGAQPSGFLQRRGYFERPMLICRWDLVSNDAYGRSPAMDGLGDQKQLQQETRRKAQGIDKMVNPPLVADIQLKNQPASLLPGGMTYISGYSSSGKPGISSIYDTKFPVNEVREDIAEVQQRLRKIFFNDLFQTASQFETRSNITAVEWDMRKSESMLMLGPALERIDNEALAVAHERIFAMAERAKILPPPPPEVQGMGMEIRFISMLAIAQNSAQASGIERMLSMAGGLAGVDPAVMDKIDIDYSLDKYSALMNNDPKLIRSAEAVAGIRQRREAAAQAEQQAAMATQVTEGAKTLSETEVGGGQNALQAMMGQGIPM